MLQELNSWRGSQALGRPSTGGDHEGLSLSLPSDVVPGGDEADCFRVPAVLQRVQHTVGPQELPAKWKAGCPGRSGGRMQEARG